MNYSSLLQDAWVDQLSYSAEEQLENFDDRSMDCSELEWELETEGDRFIDLTTTNFPSETKSIGAFLELIGSRIAEQTDVRSFFEQFCDYHDLGDPDQWNHGLDVSTYLLAPSTLRICAHVA